MNNFQGNARKFFNIISNPISFCQIQLKSELFKIFIFQTFSKNLENFGLFMKYSQNFCRMSDLFLIFIINFHRLFLEFQGFRVGFFLIIYGWSIQRWSILALYCVSKNFVARWEMPRDTARSLSKNSRLEFLKFLPESFIITLFGLFFVALPFCGPSLFFGFSAISQNSQKFAKMGNG